MILSKVQAKAVYTAMQALDAIKARIEVRNIDANNLTLTVRVTEHTVVISDKYQTFERYKTQTDFAKAYGVL